MEAAAARSVLSSLTPAAALIFFGQEYVHMREASFIEEFFLRGKFILGKIGVMIPRLHFEDQVGPLTFKKANLIPQLLFLGQIHPYTNVMLHNTLGHFLSFSICEKSSLPLAISSSQFACLAVLQHVNQTCA